jgi:hypothetical protein
MQGFDGKKERAPGFQDAGPERRSRAKWSTPRVIVSAMGKAGVIHTIYFSADQHTVSRQAGPDS